jgi:N-acetyltransferase
VKKRPLEDDEPPTKRQRVEAAVEIIEKENIEEVISTDSATSSSPTHSVSALRTSSPIQSPAAFSGRPAQSTPPSSPLPSSPPIQIRRPVFSIFRKKSESKSAATKNKPLSERSHNVQSPTKAPQPKQKKRRLVQMQLDLVGELQKTCKACGMEYIPSNAEDAALHRKFHAMNIDGVDLTKAFVERLKSNQVWAGRDGSFIAAISRKNNLAMRNKAVEILNVVNTELAAVPIPVEELWSPIRIPIAEKATMGTTGVQVSRLGTERMEASDRFKAYIYIRANKCVGACLAERIQEAYGVVESATKDDASKPNTSPLPIPARSFETIESSSISISTESEPAMLGISRIWTSSRHRKCGIATTLLEAARSNFLYGMTVEKDLIAFSQPTESGGKLARKWFGRGTGWHVYID